MTLHARIVLKAVLLVVMLQVGGATGMIGDPSGKSEERVLLTDDVVARNASQLVAGLSPVLDFDCPRTGALVVNNAEWHTKMSAVDWMRDIGRCVALRLRV